MCGNEASLKDWVNAKELSREQNEKDRQKHLDDIAILNQNARGKSERPSGSQKSAK